MRTEFNCFRLVCEMKIAETGVGETGIGKTVPPRILPLLPLPWISVPVGRCLGVTEVWEQWWNWARNTPSAAYKTSFVKPYSKVKLLYRAILFKLQLTRNKQTRKINSNTKEWEQLEGTLACSPLFNMTKVGFMHTLHTTYETRGKPMCPLRAWWPDPHHYLWVKLLPPDGISLAQFSLLPLGSLQ